MVEGLREFHAELAAKRKNARPGLNTPEWGGLEVTIADPAGNRITFVEA